MREPAAPDTEELLDRADRGDEGAVELLLDRHRDRLRRMVAIHMDRRVRARFDPSDVVQEALLDAQRELCRFLRERPLPFYPWLRQLTWDQLVRFHRCHVHAKMRSVTREASPTFQLPDHSEIQLADQLVQGATGASGRFLREESRRRVRSALLRLPAIDREILTLRFLEQLSQAEAAAVLGVTEGAVNMRQLRALKRLRTMLDQ